MNANKILFARSLTILVATLSAMGWLLFCFYQLPLIVPADHSSSFLAAYLQTSLCGLMLFFLSLGTVGLTAGFFGKEKRALAATWLLCIGWFLASWGLYPSVLGGVLSFPIRLLADGILLALILLGSSLILDRHSDASG